MLAALSKVIAECALSLYPVFVRNIGVPLKLQMWSRFFAYIAISFFFIDHTFVKRVLFSKEGLLLAAITLVHIYTSYEGFLNMPSGKGYTLFYIYPVLILLLSGYTVPFLVALIALGGWLLAMNVKSKYGVVMILLAALTEALIYFAVRKIKTLNSWNHVFLSYFLGAITITVLSVKEIRGMQLNSPLTLALGGNAILGLLGYLLRFYSISRLEPFAYAVLSNVGIVMSFVYGYAWNREIVDWRDCLGALCVVTACVLAKKK